MLTTTVIILISLCLFVFWFRYACRLMLSVHPAKDLTGKIAEANKLKFRTVQSALNSESMLAFSELDRLFQLLNRDHRIITYLMKYGACYRCGGEGLEHALLQLDYRLMMAIYKLTRTTFRGEAHKALCEMARVLNYFANSMGANMSGDTIQVALPE